MKIDPPRRREPAARTERRIGAGTLVGSIDSDGSHAWRGVPYAAPPVGRLRWRRPQPVSPWTGPRLAVAHGHPAPQFGGPILKLPTYRYGTIVGDEDCLTLNVFAPAWAPDAVPAGSERRPVMVWFPGGGNSIGSAATYDVARNLAREDDLVVVTVNHRLGILGWFRHPVLMAGRAVTEAEQSGNFGTLDQIAALEWVRDNIAAFGGDPGCVTVFGESAGAQNVLALLASPLAAGLFHRAIAQSPLAISHSADEAVDGGDPAFESERVGSREIVARLVRRHDGPARITATWLRSLSAADLLSVMNPGSGGYYGSPRPVRDGLVLPQAPFAEVFRTTKWNRVPVIIGTNRDEIRTFIADKPEYTRMVFGSVPMLIDRDAYAIESDVMSAAWRCMHLDAPVEAMVAGGHRDVWTYRFDWDEAPPLPYVRPDLMFGAAHGMEMPLVFRDRKGRLDLFKAGTPLNQAGRSRLSEAMAGAWTSFARDGRPTIPGVAWHPRGDGKGPDSLVFDTEADGGIRMAALRADIAGLKAFLQQTDRARSGRQRCQIYARTFLWSPILSGHGSPDEYADWCRRFGCSEPAEAFRPQREI